jgi:hypothetical protein
LLAVLYSREAMETYPWKRWELLGELEVLVRMAWGEEKEEKVSWAWEDERGDG